MKWVIVTQWVRTGEGHIPSDPSRASRSGVPSTCTPSTGRTKREGTRMEAAGGSPALWRVVVHRICLKRQRGKADGVQWPAGSSPGGDQARVQETPGV